MKLELLVIADQNAAVNAFPGLVHTARHTTEVGGARSWSSNRLPKAKPMTGVKSEQGSRSRTSGWITSFLRRLKFPCYELWGISSAGRAPALHAGGQGFEPLILHHEP